MAQDQYQPKPEESKVSESKSDYTVNLPKTREDASFPCEGCGAIISPGDETEEAYTIIHTEIKDGALAYLFILCKCGKITKLDGLSGTPSNDQIE